MFHSPERQRAGDGCIMVCVMTRFVFLKPLRTKSAKEVAFALVNVFANFGVPQKRNSPERQRAGDGCTNRRSGGIEEIGGVSVEENYEMIFQEMFNEVKIIEDYWSKLKKQGGNKGPKGKEKGNIFFLLVLWGVLVVCLFVFGGILSVFISLFVFAHLGGMTKIETSLGVLGGVSGA